MTPHHQPIFNEEDKMIKCCEQLKLSILNHTMQNQDTKLLYVKYYVPNKL